MLKALKKSKPLLIGSAFADTSFSTPLNKPQSDKRSGIVLATAAASLFFTVQPVQAAEAKGEVIIHCTGVNACKGQGRCGTAEHSCKGANACKGQGILPMTKEECETKGGKPKELVIPKS